MGNDQVAATTMNVDLVAEVLQGHRRALDVPAGTTLTPGAGPEGLAGCAPLPENKVERISFPGISRIGAPLPGHLDHGLTRKPAQTAVVSNTVDSKVHISIAAIGMPLGFELADKLDDPWNGLTCPGKDVRGVDIERGEIRFEERGFLSGEPIPGRVELAGPPNDVIVDIGHVLHVAHLDRLRAQGPHQNVERDVGERVAEMGGVIGRDAADVDANRAVAALERLHRPSFSVVQPHRLTVIEG